MAGKAKPAGHAKVLGQRTIRVSGRSLSLSFSGRQGVNTSPLPFQRKIIFPFETWKKMERESDGE
jgi:hypothetical protein